LHAQHMHNMNNIYRAAAICEDMFACSIAPGQHT
jgi:hypothetical protein